MTLPDAVVTSARLRLVPLTLPLIEAVLGGDVERAQALSPFALDGTTFAHDRHVLELRRSQLQADPSEEPWLYRAAVDRKTGVVAGRIGFHAPPDAEGTVEVGYSVALDRRRQGLATEMATALIVWGRGHGARRVLASTSPDNLASQGVIARLGFVRTGEQMDEIDGLEWVYTLEPPDPSR